MLPSKKPDLAIIVGNALGKKGMKNDSPKDDEGESEDHDYLEEIASDMLKAFEDKDPKALAELLKEAFTCLETPEDSDESK